MYYLKTSHRFLIIHQKLINKVIFQKFQSCRRCMNCVSSCKFDRIIRWCESYSLIENNTEHISRSEAIPGRQQTVLWLWMTVVNPRMGRTLDILERGWNYRLSRAGRIIENDYGMRFPKIRVYWLVRWWWKYIIHHCLKIFS